MTVRKWQGTTEAQVTIHFFDRTIRSTGMIDSGNKLYEPLTRLPVMFLSREACDDALPSGLFHHEGGFQSLLDDESLPGEWKSRVTMIPYSSVDGSRQWITAIRPDRVIINHEGKKIESPRVFVALTDHQLSGAGDFDSILHPDMLIHGKMIIPAS
ncbi:sigma-E processing peptidase SpoIIGA [Terrilactibacillus sp. S3-3]|nr:sigma-E processing peptidase SpoIIGA [Terrilactibacillus sp. S3-3]